MDMAPTIEGSECVTACKDSIHPSKPARDVSKVEKILKPFVLDDEALKKMMKLLAQNLDAGLGSRTNATAIVKMFPSYVRSIPDHTEAGKFMALDLGGTNFRVLLVELFKDREPRIESQLFFVPDSIMTGPGDALFDHITDSISTFLEVKQITLDRDNPIPLGFTFSFPCRQEGLDIGVLETWTKGFRCSGVEGHDVVQLLEEAIARKGGLHVKCLAVLNDTVGTMLSCAYEDSRCLIGLILGTGFNACYMEQLKNIELWEGERTDPEQVIVNTEWGAFGGDGCLDFLRTDIDMSADLHSKNPGKHTFEKMISGMYLGEIVRRILVRLIEENCLFGGQLPPLLAQPGRFITKYISDIEETMDDVSGARRVLEELGVSCKETDELQLVVRVCQVVSRRAALLASAGIAVLLNKIGRKDVTIGVDGSVYKYHPHIKNIMHDTIKRFIKPTIQYRLQESQDGSGRGAALVAAVAQRVQTNFLHKQRV